MSSVILACTRVTIILLVSCLATCAAGSACLSYGHSCWGAHGKRSGTSNDGQWFLSKLGPANSWKSRRTLLPLSLESSALRHLNLNENSLEGADNTLDLLPSETDYPEEDEDNPAALGVEAAVRGPRSSPNKEKPVIVMEQSPRLYKLLSQARKLDLSNVNPSGLN
uniref:Neuropeptide CCH1 n=1 Tax=Diaphorina citri TaxID=121845 RepID=A0A2U9PFQ1_DIACI|nr:neuropeptide CCH1 [Diaphorina citri]